MKIDKNYIIWENLKRFLNAIFMNDFVYSWTFDTFFFISYKNHPRDFYMSLTTPFSEKYYIVPICSNMFTENKKLPYF